MSDDKALAIRENNKHSLSLRTMDDVERLAGFCAQSGFFKDAREAAQAVVKIVAGFDHNLPPTVALSKIQIVEGKVTVPPEIMAAKIKESGRYNYRIVQLDNSGCTLDFYEDGEKVFTSTFTAEDAKKANLLSKDVWQRYPRNLYFARTMSNGARWVCPHVINGLYTPEELGAETDEGGNVVQGVVVSSTMPSSTGSAMPITPPTTSTETQMQAGKSEGSNGKSLNIQIKDWPGFCEQLAAECSHYADKNGSPNKPHIANAIKLLKYPTINEENRTRIYDALLAHADAKTNPPALDAAQESLLAQGA